MKKFVLFALMGLVMMGSFTSCKKDKQEKEFKEKIVGKWKAYSVDGALKPTNLKNVDEFFADGTVKTTRLRDGYWECSKSGSYKIEGNKFTRMKEAGVDDPATNTTATIASITDMYFVRNNVITPLSNVNCDEYIMERVTVDYKQAFVGLWEGVSMTGDVTYGAADHRWKFNADGTFVYYTKNAENQWEADPSNYGNNYYVDGNFFGGRWFKDDVEYKEWWDIDYCNDTEMRWSALRQKEDGSLFTTTMTMKRVVEN